MAKEIKYYGQLRPTGVDDSAARRLQAIAGLADQVQDVAYQAGARMAQREGEREGAIAGQKAAQDAESQRQAKEVADSLRDFNDVEGSGGQSTLTSSQAAAVAGQPLEKRAGILSAFSIKDNSYNDALESAYLSQVSVDSQEQVARIAAQYSDDVEGFGKAAAEVRKGITSSIDPNYQGVVGATLDNVIQSYETKVFANQAARGRALADESRLANIETLGRNAASFARNGDAEQAAFTLLEAKTVLDSMAPKNGESWVTEQYRLLVREVKEQEVKHGLANKLEIEGRDAAFKSLSELKNTGEFTADEFDALKSGAKAMLERDVSIQEASRQVASEKEAETVKDYINLISMGGSPDSALTSQVNNIIAGDADLTETVNLARSVASFSLGSGAQRQNDLAAAQEDAEKGVGVDVYLAKLKAQASIEDALEKDPLGLAVSQGLVVLDDISEVLLSPKSQADSSPINAQNAYDKRVELARRMTAHYGVPVPPLTDGELSALADQIPKMTVPEKVILAQTMAPTFKGDPSAQLPGLLSEKNQEVFAQAAAIGNPDIMSAIFRGQEILNAGGLAYEPKQQDYLSIFESYVGNVYDTDNKASTLQAALAHYAGTAPPDKQFKPSYFRKSLIAVAGEIDEINGFKTSIPRVARDADEFQSFVDNIDAEFMSVYYPKSQAQEKAEIVRRAQFRAVGENDYRVMIGGQSVAGANGEPLKISYDPAVAKVLKARKQGSQRKKSKQKQAVYNRGGKFFSGVEREEDLLTIPDRSARPLRDGDEDPTMYRADGSKKSARGYLGPVENLVQGGTMTEVSIGVPVNGKEMEVPAMVPTLTQEEIDTLANMQIEGNAKNIPKSIKDKAIAHAKKRLAAGKSVFYVDGEDE
jgi:hypothetical protein